MKKRLIYCNGGWQEPSKRITLMPMKGGWYYSVSSTPAGVFPPVILIHGAGGNHLNWGPEIRQLSGYRIYAPDLPGHGKSEGIAQQSIERYVTLLREFLEAEKIYHAILIGHSMGGIIGLQFANQYPDRIAGLGVLSSGACMGVDPQFLYDLSHETTVQAAIKQLQLDLFAPETPVAVIEKINQSLQAIRPSVLYNDWCACAGIDLRNVVHKINVPTWIAVGEYDHLTPPAFSRFLALNMPNATLQVIPGAGHMLIIEQKEAVISGLRVFFSKLREKYPVSEFN